MQGGGDVCITSTIIFYLSLMIELSVLNSF